MNSRELTLISTAAVAGAIAAAIGIRFLVNPRKKLLSVSSASEDVTQRKLSSNDPYDPSKRNGYLSWDDYFMAISFVSAERSKDPNRQVGACLVSQDDIILGKNQSSVIFQASLMSSTIAIYLWRWFVLKSKFNDPLETKYAYVCHAEVNCILNTNHASAAVQDVLCIENTLWETSDPFDPFLMYHCNECAIVIIQVKRHQPKMNQIVLRFLETQ